MTPSNPRPTAPGPRPLSENRIQSIGEVLSRVLEVKNEARERAMADSRATIRNCAHSIRASHRGELDSAREQLRAAGEMVVATRSELIGSQPDSYWAWYVQYDQR